MVHSNLLNVDLQCSRRGATASGDVDVLITHPKYSEKDKKSSEILDKIIQKLKKNQFLTDDISHGNVKYSTFFTEKD